MRPCCCCCVPGMSSCDRHKKTPRQDSLSLPRRLFPGLCSFARFAIHSIHYSFSLGSVCLCSRFSLLLSRSLVLATHTVLARSLARWTGCAAWQAKSTMRMALPPTWVKITRRESNRETVKRGPREHRERWKDRMKGMKGNEREQKGMSGKESKGKIVAIFLSLSSFALLHTVFLSNLVCKGQVIRS